MAAAYIQVHFRLYFIEANTMNPDSRGAHAYKLRPKIKNVLFPVTSQIFYQ